MVVIDLILVGCVDRERLPSRQAPVPRGSKLLCTRRLVGSSGWHSHTLGVCSADFARHKVENMFLDMTKVQDGTYCFFVVNWAGLGVKQSEASLSVLGSETDMCDGRRAEQDNHGRFI